MKKHMKLLTHQTQSGDVHWSLVLTELPYPPRHTPAESVLVREISLYVFGIIYMRSRTSNHADGCKDGHSDTSPLRNQPK